jgi:hypothetical protein
MSILELAVFGVLGASVTVGLWQMGSDAFKFSRRKDAEGGESNNQSALSAAYPMNWGKKED